MHLYIIIYIGFLWLGFPWGMCPFCPLTCYVIIPWFTFTTNEIRLMSFLLCETFYKINIYIIFITHLSLLRETANKSVISHPWENFLQKCFLVLLWTLPSGLYEVLEQCLVLFSVDLTEPGMNASRKKLLQRLYCKSRVLRPSWNVESKQIPQKCRRYH